MATDLMSPRRRYAASQTEPQLDDPERLYGGEAGMKRVGGQVVSKTPLAAVATKPAAGLYPPGTKRSSGDKVAADGTITTSRRTSAQNAEIGAFNRSQGFTPAAPVASPADPYDLDYAENTTGTFGSQRNAAPVNAPAAKTRPDGLAVKALGNAGALEQAGARVAPLASVAYKPTTDPVEKLPVTRYEAPASAPAIAPVPMATPSAPLPAPSLTSATPSATNVPSPTPTPAPAPATPAATPQIAPTPGTSEGARLASGVSNSSVAQFAQPTASNPLPTTPTTPVTDVEDYDKKNRKQFSGF